MGKATPSGWHGPPARPGGLPARRAAPGAERPDLNGLLPIIRRPRRPLLAVDPHAPAPHGVPVPLVVESLPKPLKSHGTATKTTASFAPKETGAALGRT